MTFEKGHGAKIALNTWRHPDMTLQFRILPVSLNYNSFSRFSKQVIIAFGEPIFYNNIPEEKNEAEQIVILNKLLYARLEKETLIEKESTDVIQFLLTNLHVIKTQIHNAAAVLKEKQYLLVNNDYTHLRIQLQLCKYLTEHLAKYNYHLHQKLLRF